MHDPTRHYSTLGTLHGHESLGKFESTSKLLVTCRPKSDKQTGSIVEHNNPADQALQIQEQERQRIAADLHDGLGQMLTLLSIELCKARHIATSCGADESELTTLLESASATVRNVVIELRRTVMALYPSILDDLGITASFNWFLREVRTAEPRLTIESQVSVDESAVPPTLRIVVFRILQEAVNNVLKHAEAKKLIVNFCSSPEKLSLTIIDDGKGICASGKCLSGTGAGLAGMSQRAKASGGEIKISSVHGYGTNVTVQWSNFANL